MAFSEGEKRAAKAARTVFEDYYEGPDDPNLDWLWHKIAEVVIEQWVDANDAPTPPFRAHDPKVLRAGIERIRATLRTRYSQGDLGCVYEAESLCTKLLAGEAIE